MTNPSTTNPRYSTPSIRRGAAIDQHSKADIAALADSIAVRQIDGSIPADFNSDALIAQVTRVTRRLRLLDNLAVTDSKANMERRENQYRHRLHPVSNPLPADTFEVTYMGGHRRSFLTVTLTVNPDAQTPALTVKVSDTEQHPGSNIEYATLYAARALETELAQLTA